jgi:hypothetical protein
MAAHACSIPDCRGPATHEVLEAVVDAKTGRPALRQDARLPYLCAVHAKQGGAGPTLARIDGRRAWLAATLALLP